MLSICFVLFLFCFQSKKKKKIFLSDPEIQEPARFVHVTDRVLTFHLTWKKKKKG